MGIEAEKDKLVGKAKEHFGNATNDEGLQAEGVGQQLKGKLEQAGDAIKNKAEELKGKLS